MSWGSTTSWRSSRRARCRRIFSTVWAPTYVAGLFRAARFGVHEAHGQGTVSQFNYLLEKGALEVDEEGRFRAVPEKFQETMRELLNLMLMLQANGDYERYGGISKAVRPRFGGSADPRSTGSTMCRSISAHATRPREQLGG